MHWYTSADPFLPADFLAEIKQPQISTDKAKAKGEQAGAVMFSFTQTYFHAM
jgi:hypothetical protein